MLMVKKTVQQKPKKSDQRVDYYPNRMGLAVAATAAVCLTLLGVIAVYN
jgi:hypothetical protein